MTNILSAEVRKTETRGAINELRAARKMPAVVYGPEVEPISITIGYNQFEKVLQAAGESSLIEIDIDGTKHNVLIKDVQTDPATSRFSHVDFFEVSMKKELEAAADINFIDESPAVRDAGGTLVKVKDALTIRCLPKDLVRAIDVSLAALKTFDDVITVGDIKAPAGVTFVEEAEELIAKVSAPLTEEQLKAMEAENAAGVDKVEVVGKKEGEEAEAEGAEAKEKEKGKPAA